MNIISYKRELLPIYKFVFNKIELKPTDINNKNQKFKFTEAFCYQVIVKQVNSSLGICWSYSGVTPNVLTHAITGNKKIGYNVAIWNCRKGLLKGDGSPSAKVTDIQLYLQKHNLDLFGVIESDLHSSESRIYRKHPLSTSEIHQKLHIDGYSLLRPQSWYSHGQARVIGYVRECLKIKERKINRADSDLPSISIELGIGREKKTCFNLFYREFTGGISGLKDVNSQKDRLTRQIDHWKSLYAGGKDFCVLASG